MRRRAGAVGVGSQLARLAAFVLERSARRARYGAGRGDTRHGRGPEPVTAAAPLTAPADDDEPHAAAGPRKTRPARGPPDVAHQQGQHRDRYSWPSRATHAAGIRPPSPRAARSP